jgi:hypothetical protein
MPEAWMRQPESLGSISPRVYISSKGIHAAHSTPVA